MIRDANQNWGSYDGFDDALTAAVTLPSTIALMDFKNCVQCYITATGVSFDTSKFLTKLYEMVIKPMADTQALLDSLPYITRLYTTMSAAEMTLDPAFDFNPDIKDVSNIHTANRIIECTSGSANPSTGPWRVELAQGDIVRGTGTTWPVKITDAPAALKILEYGKTGEAKVIMDLTNMVSAMLKKNAGTTTASGTAGSKSGSAGTGTGPGTGATGGSGSGANSADGGVVGSAKKNGGGCAVADTQPTGSLSPLLFSLAALFVRRRR
jgi:MYXO-CTERM domain-containing protein